MSKKLFHVIVTGGAPMKGHDVNTSTLIRDRLPEHVYKDGKATVSILKYPNDVDCRYGSVVAKMQDVWSGKRSLYLPPPGPLEPERIAIDLVMHMGMDRNRTHYTLDTRARKDGYERPGQDGLYLQADIFKGLPELLESMFSAETTIARLKTKVPSSIVIETSPDAGRFFCGFQLFSSLAEVYRKGEPKRVVFFHIPEDTKEENLERGVEAAVAIITELAEQSLNSSATDARACI